MKRIFKSLFCTAFLIFFMKGLASANTVDFDLKLQISQAASISNPVEDIEKIIATNIKKLEKLKKQMEFFKATTIDFLAEYINGLDGILSEKEKPHGAYEIVRYFYSRIVIKWFFENIHFSYEGTKFPVICVFLEKKDYKYLKFLYDFFPEEIKKSFENNGVNSEYFSIWAKKHLSPIIQKPKLSSKKIKRVTKSKKAEESPTATESKKSREVINRKK